MTRISDAQMFSSSLARLQSSRAKLADKQAIAQTGLKHTRASDDPSWARAMASVSHGRAMNTRQQENLKRGRGRLEASDSALDQATNLIARAQELATQMATDTYNGSDRAAAAEEIASLRDSLIAVANTQTTDGGYIFSGFQTATAAFSAAGVFQGDTSDVRIDAGQGVTASVSIDGATAFTSNVDVFAMMASLEAAMRSNDSVAIRGQIASINTSVDQLTNSRAQVGARMQALDALTAKVEDAQSRLEEQQANEVEADPLEAYSQLTQAQSALEASLKISATAMQKSLLDYL